MLSLLLIAYMAVVNRLRGGGFGAWVLPGHPRFWCVPLVMVIAFAALGDVTAALLFGACWLAWCMLPWGFLMCLGHWEPVGREMSRIERLCLKASGGNYLLALQLRHLVGLIPMAVLVSPWALVLPPFIALGYAAGWRWAKAQHEIETGELITGALFGSLLAWIAV